MNTNFRKSVELAAFNNDIELQSELNNFEGTLTFAPDTDSILIDINGKEKYQICNREDAREVCEDENGVMRNFGRFECVSFIFEGEEYFFVEQ